MRFANFKRLGKKTTASLLAFIMVFGYFAVFEGVLRAAPIPLSSNLSENLVPSGLTIDPSPTPATNLPQGMIHLSFPISYNPVATSVDENTFHLHFPMGDRIRILTVLLTSDTTAIVAYHPITPLGAGAPNFFVNLGVAPGATASADFVQIGSAPLVQNTPLLQPGDFGYVAGLDTPVPGFGFGRYYPDPYNYNISVEVGSSFMSIPQFNIEQGHGFSFAPQGGTNPNMNQANAVSFLWDGTDFRVVVGGMQQGRIYDFVLEHLGETSTRSVFTGFLYEARPVARHRETTRTNISGQHFPQYDNYIGTLDELFGRPPWTGVPVPPPPAGPFPDGWTNWELPPAPTVMGSPFHVLANINNILRHDNPIGHEDNDWYPGGFDPYTTGGIRTDNMLEFAILVPERVPRDPATGLFPPASTFQILTQAQAEALFAGANFVFEIAGPTGPSFEFNISNLFGPTPTAAPSPEYTLHFRPLASGGTQMGILLDGPHPFSLPPSMLFIDSTLQMGGALPSTGPNAVHHSWVNQTDF
ncbi:MAG: hypothetical protein FWD97_09515, partial [Defluviitaleaceae bacterium]|nr:hypothetical protein [Defluviitaleaceae bacterium]